jgi:hypothetical protein
VSEKYSSLALSLCKGGMDSVFELFDFMKESTWIETLMYTYGYQDFNPINPDYKMLGDILFELHESTWSDQLHLYKPDIEDVGLKFLTVLDMRNIYLDKISSPEGTQLQGLTS